MDMAGGSVMDCLPYLTNLSENYRQDTGKTYVTGYAGNLRTGISEHGVSITGSLAKFYLGTNLHTLTRSDTIKAFEMMADTLHLPIHKAKVTRIDAGQNIITDYKPELYYPYFGSSAYYTRLAQPKSISYQNSLRSKKAYDKIAESIKNKVAIPEVYARKNLLRFELSYTARLNKQFNQQIITPDTLTDERFYIDVFDRYFNEYDNINKLGLPAMDKSKMRTSANFLKQAGEIALRYWGKEFLNVAEEMKNNNEFTTPKEYDRIKKLLRQHITGSKDEQSELIKELNSKMERVRRYYR
ncbi:phage/plasmid replication domain-containing protein [Pontibacter pudoricolor]|uniref:phage/plasmid replication domain-containing protein n=1 Tax=Pontibacter pudoricolor TaxID=2694930 RepID=UPI0013908684|nr:phage/plasmid replication protein [Pontibacter pudoricolor]